MDGDYNVKYKLNNEWKELSHPLIIGSGSGGPVVDIEGLKFTSVSHIYNTQYYDLPVDSLDQVKVIYVTQKMLDDSTWQAAMWDLRNNRSLFMDPTNSLIVENDISEVGVCKTISTNLSMLSTQPSLRNGAILLSSPSISNVLDGTRYFCSLSLMADSKGPYCYICYNTSGDNLYIPTQTSSNLWGKMYVGVEDDGSSTMNIKRRPVVEESTFGQILDYKGE